MKFRYVYKEQDYGEFSTIVYTIEFLEKEIIAEVPGFELISRDLFSGYTDKNGNDIFENDIIETDDGCKVLVQYGDCYELLTSDGCYGWYCIYLNKKEIAEKYKIDEILDEEKLRGCHFNSSFMNYSKVIGNNHERTVDG